MEEEKDKNQPKIVEYINDFPEETESQFNYEKNKEEQHFQFLQKKAARQKKLLKNVGISLVIVAMLAAAGVLYVRSRNAAQPIVQKEILKVDIPENQDHVFANDVNGVDDQTDVVDDSSGYAGKSENYRLKDIAVGGSNLVLSLENENLPIKISNVRTQSFLSEDQKSIKVLVSWDTNKLAKSKVFYSKDGSQGTRNISEQSYGFSHALVLNKLDQSTRYMFTVEATDRSGNKDTSTQLAVYTGSKPQSVFELISGELDDMFGWAIKK